jgi:hypothetical protein
VTGVPDPQADTGGAADVLNRAADRLQLLGPVALARAFHEAYERLAPDYGYKTREASAKPWAEVPADNRLLMTAVAAEILAMLPVAALAPVLRHAASGAVRRQFDALSVNETRLVDLLVSFARRVLREEEETP